MSLQLINETVQQVADAITAAMDIETEIVDSRLRIVAGTGRFKSKIGSLEEDGDVDGSHTYATCLRTGSEYINFNPSRDPLYDAKENEMAEFCCPIKADGDIVGLIGLIALTEPQREIMVNKANELITFLRIMADLIAGKLIVQRSNTLLEDKVQALLPATAEDASFSGIIGNSRSIVQIKKRALQVAQSDSTILITGESGTGKDLLARSIHKESPRREHPFISINCSAIPESLLESELFGYVKGAFTGASKTGKLGKFQLADRGTVFLDEIGDMPLHMQAKLLTCIQNRQVEPVGGSKPVDVDVRIIAATNRNLEEMVAENRFRDDLYFRLNVIPIHIPPLREHPEDIEALLDYALHKYCDRLSKTIKGVDSEARKALTGYRWPGNVRELENAMEYAVNIETDSTIHMASLPDKIKYPESARPFGTSGSLPESACPAAASDSAHPVAPGASGTSGTNLKSNVARFEAELITSCLEVTGTSFEGKRAAAGMLGISESTLYRKIKELGI